MCVHIGWTGPGEPHEDGEMNEMSLPSRHRIRNASPGGLGNENEMDRALGHLCAHIG